MEVVFSELSKLNLLKIYPNEDKRHTIMCAIHYFLENNKAKLKAWPAPSFADKDTYLYEIDGNLVLLTPATDDDVEAGRFDLG